MGFQATLTHSLVHKQLDLVSHYTLDSINCLFRSPLEGSKYESEQSSYLACSIWSISPRFRVEDGDALELVESVLMLGS
jgi:hypothetical protein